MIKGVIFDLDGVLVSTDQLHYAAWKTIADREGIYFDQEINLRLRGVSRMDCVDILLELADKPYTQEEKRQLAEDKNRIYAASLTALTPKAILPGVVEVLTALRRDGYRLAVGSASKNARSILKQLKLLPAFDAISDGTLISHSKPGPEVFLKASELLGLHPKECAVVEDAPAGIQAAKRAGMLAFGLGPARHYPLTDYSLAQLEGLLPILLNLALSHPTQSC